MDPPLSFGDWLQQRRRALGLTRQELAQRVGCSVSAVRKLETGERRPSSQVSELLASHLELPPEARPTFLNVARGLLGVERLLPPEPPGAPPVPAAPRAPPVRERLPVNPTPLIGRERELAVLGAMLADPACRLLTLTGPGGIGKTRLAVRTARLAAAAFADGAAFVPLTPLTSTRFVLPAVAAALSFTFAGPAEAQTQLLDYLHGRQLLLVLDNVEHLLADGAAEHLANLLECAPGVKLVVTSLEVLGLQAEWVFEVQGLPVPAVVAAGAGAEGSAVDLFVQQARRARVGFVPTDGDNAAIVRICQLVEGLPLAIELAAAWVRVLSCQEIAREIERSLDFLTVTARDLPERHRSLRAVFDHSWQLLAEAERQVLCALPVFHGGFTREAAEQVAGASLELLSALATKSLVHRTEQRRCDLHSVVRQYAEHQSAPADELRQAHSRYYLAFLQQQQRALRSARLREARETLAAEAANIREAWRWAVGHNDFEHIRQAAGSLIDMYDWLYWYAEGEQVFSEAVRCLQAQPSARAERSDYARALGAVLLGQEVFDFRMGRPRSAADVPCQCLELFEEAGDTEAQADAWQWLGNMHYKQGDYPVAVRALRQGLALHEALADPWGQAMGLNFLALVALVGGDYPAAERLLQEALAFFRGCGNPIMIITVLSNLCRVFRLQHRYEQARSVLEEASALSRDIGDHWSIGICLDSLGQLALEQGRYDEARRDFDQALAEFRDIDDCWARVRIMTNLGRIEQAQGNLPAARQIVSEALRQAQQANFVPRMLEALVSLAGIWAATGRQERALEALEFVRVHSITPRESRDQAERLRAELQPQLAPEQINAVQARVQGQAFEAWVKEVALGMN